jgi:putative flippase GtrA
MIDLSRFFSPEVARRLERIVKFAVTGGIGFTVDIGLLTLQTAVFDINPYTARLLAIAVAMTTTWLVNRRFTFKVHEQVTDAKAVVAEGGRYVLVAVGAALVNYGIYAGALQVLPHEILGTDDLAPPIAAVFGTLVAMFVSYFGYSRFAFRVPDLAER